MAFLAGAAFTLLPAASAATDTLPQPTGPVILTVDGKISRTNGPGVARFDRSMLEMLGMTTLKTLTSWTEGEVAFEGVPAKRLMESVGATGTHVSALALNDYKADIPISDFDLYHVMLALKQDGTTLTVRDKGPIWIVYEAKSSDVSERADVRMRMVWQLSRLTVQ